VKILLFGGNGQVGWELQRALSPFGHLVVPDRKDADLENPARLAAMVAAEAPDIVVNAAAYTAVDAAETDIDRAHAVNAVAVDKLARAALARGALLIHYSTDYVFDGLKTTAYCESDATNAVAIVADQFGAPTSAELLADITAIAVARHKSSLALPSGLYHLTSSGSASWHEFARFILNQALLRGYDLKARPETVVPISSSELKAAAPRPRNSVMDTSKLSSALNVTFPDWTHHVRRTVLEILEGSSSRRA
jgi:dTDP-4-dehydrorhamnose reductase